MRSITVGDRVLPLHGLPEAYGPLIAEEGRAAAGQLALGSMMLRHHQRDHVQWWTGERLRWDSPDNAGLRATRDAWLAKVAGNIVLDLGCGPSRAVRRMQAFLKHYNARAYLGVDRIPLDGGEQPDDTVAGIGPVTTLSEERGYPLPGVFVHADILQVTGQLPTDSFGAVVVNGLDESLVPMHTRFGNANVEQAIRVVRPDGLICGIAVDGLLAVLHESGAITGVREPLGPADAPSLFLMTKAA